VPDLFQWFPLPNFGTYGILTSVKWIPDFHNHTFMPLFFIISSTLKAIKIFTDEYKLNIISVSQGEVQSLISPALTLISGILD